MIGIGGRNSVQALMVTAVVVVGDEGRDLLFDIARWVVIFKQGAVFQRVVPTLDFALGLRMARHTTYVLDVFAPEPFCEGGGV
jgi:hypothetical protein